MGAKHVVELLDADALVRRPHARRRAAVDEGGDPPRPPEPGVGPPSPTTGRGVTPCGPAPALRTRCPTISCPGSDQFASMSPVSSSSKRTPSWRPAIEATSPLTSSREIPTGSRKSTSSTHFAGSMLIETPPRTVPTFTDTRRITSAAPAPSEASMAARTSGRSRASRTTEGSSGAFDSIVSEVPDEMGGEPVRARSGVRVGAVAARPLDGEPEPEHRLLPEADRPEAARLGVEHAVPEHLVAAALGQPAGPPPPPGLLVRDHGQGDPAGKLVPQAVKVRVREEERDRPAVHVDGPPPVDPAVREVPGERIARPRGAVAGREHVEVPVQHEVPALPASPGTG